MIDNFFIRGLRLPVPVPVWVKYDRIKVGKQLMPGWKGWQAESGEEAMWAEVFQTISPPLHLQEKDIVQIWFVDEI